MPNTLDQYFTKPDPQIDGSISLTLTNTVYHSPEPTFDIDATVTIYDPDPTSQPQIQVSLTHE